MVFPAFPCGFLFDIINRQSEGATILTEELGVDGIWLPQVLINIVYGLLARQQALIECFKRPHSHSCPVFELPNVGVQANFRECMYRCNQVTVPHIIEIDSKFQWPAMVLRLDLDASRVHGDNNNRHGMLRYHHGRLISARDKLIQLYLRLFDLVAQDAQLLPQIHILAEPAVRVLE